MERAGYAAYVHLVVEGTYGVERDEALGATLLRRSAEAGNADGTLGFAGLYSLGCKGMKQSNYLAIEQTRKSSAISRRPPIAIYA